MQITSFLNCGNYPNGFLELATVDDGTEPIYIRQYTGYFNTSYGGGTYMEDSTWVRVYNPNRLEGSIDMLYLS